MNIKKLNKITTINLLTGKILLKNVEKSLNKKNKHIKVF
jgi:hypothetical protein